jgi:hypothetical protein
MLDDTEAAEKPTLTPRPAPPVPTPICTLMSDRSLKLEPGAATNLMELQSLLLSAAAMLTLDVVRRAQTSEQLLFSIQAKFALDPEIDLAINRALRAG